MTTGGDRLVGTYLSLGTRRPAFDATIGSMNLTVVDNTDESRFEARTDDDSVAGWVDYRRRPDSVTLVHTEVDGSYHGSGVGSRLVSATLATVTEEGVSVINECPFITRFLQRHPGEYDSVVDATD